jgi:uncharacterized protein YigE (DUF2233 family)
MDLLIMNKTAVLILFCLFVFQPAQAQVVDDKFVSFTVDPASVNLYWKDDHGEILKSIQNLKAFVQSKGKRLKFAMNGGMFRKDNSAQGLFIQDHVTITPLDTLSGGGNFYMKPNGVFYITRKNEAVVCKTTGFADTGEIKIATQSGPMLVIDGEIHPTFKKGSANLNIRNGVGILPDNRIIFVMSKEAVNFYDFASCFKNLGCKNALYLDGFVSRMYLPEKKWEQLDGNFGVLIGVTE